MLSLDKVKELVYEHLHTHENRYIHTLGVVKIAKYLAGKLNYDETKAEIAAYMHDYSKYDDFHKIMLKSNKLFCDMYDSGFDYRQVWIDRLKEIGIHPWISIRTNDIHECQNEESLLFSDFYKNNRKFIVGNHRNIRDYYDYALDYAYDDVRMFYLSVISEALDKYDVYGLELDFMREIYSFSRGEEFKGKEIMNSFVHQVAALVWQAERERKHRVKLAVRVPSSLELAMHLGYDVFEWINNGWIDHVTITPRWATSDGDLNVELWKSLLKTTKVTLACGLEVLCNTKRKFTGINNTKETVYGYAKAYSDLGADYIYLFNYMHDVVGNTNDNNSIFENNNYNEVMRTIGNPKLLETKNRRHVLTYNDTFCVGYPVRLNLPIIFEDNSVKNFRILTGSVKNKMVKLVLGFSNEIKTNNISVWLNKKQFSLVEENVIPKLPAPNDLKYYSCSFYSLEDEYIMVGEISSNENCKIEWVEIDVE